MGNAFWAWTLTVQQDTYDQYESTGRETFCSSEQGVAARIFASREEAEAHFHAWFSAGDRHFFHSWEEGTVAGGETSPMETYSLEIYTLAV